MEKIVDYFLHGMMDEVQTGKSFEFSDAEKTQFVQDINLFLRENSGFVAYTLGFDPAMLSDELSNEFNRSMFLRLSDNLLNLLLENNSILLCLLLTAKARPYLTANFDNHAYNLLVMEMVMLQRKQEMPGVGYLLQSIDPSSAANRLSEKTGQGLRAWGSAAMKSANGLSNTGNYASRMLRTSVSFWTRAGAMHKNCCGS